MRRKGIIVALGALVAVFGTGAIAAPALAGGRGDGWQFGPATPSTLDASVCGFPVLVNPVAGKEFTKELKGADGTMAFLTTGTLKVSYTNLDSGKTITENVSGPAKVTVFPDNSAVVTAKGNNAFVLPPAVSASSGIPRLALTAGAETLSIDPDGNFTSASLNGTVKADLCAALS